ncbi:AAA family ATPase [Candidatus Uhrbacteria bacterium]|nr:AAA family ATPase [Candidatus Uhrbacteria bacterium]
MSERPSGIHEQPKEARPAYDFSTIMGLPVDYLGVPKEVEEMASAYLTQFDHGDTNKAQRVEWAYALRRQLQEDLRRVKREDLLDIFEQDESYAFSLAVYRRLLKDPDVSQTLGSELKRHERENEEVNGSYEEFKSLEQQLDDERGKLIALLSEMFKRSGQEPKPVHLMKRSLLESKVEDLEQRLEAIKHKNPDVAALIEYDTVKSYADQLRTTGFIWTKSRQRLLQEVLQGALTSRPVAAMMGETGTGKTALARAASLELASREPERTVGGDQEKFVRLLASPAIQEGKTYYEYGPLLRAMTGKSSSIDDQPSKGGGIFFDDEFNTRPTSVQRQILKFVSEARAGRKVTIPGTPLTVTVEPGFLYLAAGNPPSERYDREETGIETKREFAGNVINVEYLEQTKDNPELYQVMLAALMDQKTGRLTAVTPNELEPAWIKDGATGQSHLDEDPTHGGYLYRFAQAWGELFKAFSHQDTVLHKKDPSKPKAEFHLSSFILDPGVVLSWIDQYKASPRDRKEHLAVFFKAKLEKYLSQFPQEEQTLVRKYFEVFNILATQLNLDEVSKPRARVLTPKDVGYLNPNVERPRAKEPPPLLRATDFLDPNTGDVVFQYVKRPLKDGWDPGMSLKRKDTAPATMPEQGIFLGFLYDETAKAVDKTKAILVAKDDIPSFFDPERLRDFYDLDLPPTPEPGAYAESRTPFAYDKAKAKEYGFSELKIEKHEKAQEIFMAVYNRDSAFVTHYNIGDRDPDSTTTPPAVLTTEKWKVNKTALQDKWNTNCPDLPNIPEKSMWFFQALTEHRLAQTIDNDDLDFLKIAKEHIPDFGTDAFLLAMDYPEFDYTNDQEKQSALTPQTKKILQTLFNTQDPTNITRNGINIALWTNHDQRFQSQQAKAVITELLKNTNQNPDDFELRLMRYDEYARAAKTQSYGNKNLWTHFDGYYAHGDGRRRGLIGGSRGDGGAARVGRDPRAARYDNLGVRLVLSRKSS